MNEVQIGALVIVIISLCQAIKYANVINTRYIPLMAIVLGIAGSLYLGGASWLSVLAGVVTAFTASGIFSAFKKTVLNK